MRFLLLSDTHGKLGIINELAADVRADAVIHAGDFGFYDDGSYERLSDRELRLQIKHSGLDSTDKQRILALPREERIAATRNECPLSELPFYVCREKRFVVPVYAVWGNHEDKHVVEKFFCGDLEVENLRILHHRSVFRVGPALVYGVGGNFLAGSNPVFSPGFVARAAKGSQMLGFSRIGRRSRSRATSRSTICEKHDRWLPFAARSRHPVRRPG